MLDWLGPVWAASASAGEEAIELESHAFETLEAPRRERAETTLPPEVKALVGLLPIDGAPRRPESVDALIRRLSYQYPHERETNERAAQSVTSLAKGSVTKGEVSTSAAREDADGSARDGALLRLPAFFTSSEPLAAVDIGTATHLALQHLRFSDAVNRRAIELQLDAMVADHKLPPEHRDSIDLAAIEWLMQSEMGQLLREQEPRLMRELPVNFLYGDAPDPMDRTMVRGRIDLLVPTPTGLIVVDYKTDYAPTAAAVDVLAMRYGPQLRMYAQALERIHGKPVLHCALVFLRARQVRNV
jgi:ATP-dependent helicase/nuclease subunit A